MTYKIPNPKVKEKKEKIYAIKNKPFDIYAHNYSWRSDEKGIMKVSLGNLTDAGWYWSGNQNDLNGFLFRLNHSEVKNKFFEDVKKNNISFIQIKPYLLKSVKSKDGLYEMSGDDVVWHFGQIDNDVDEAYEIAEAELTKEQGNNAYSEYNPITYEQFEKKNSKYYQEQMEKAINESNTFEEFMGKQEDISQELNEDRMNENQRRFNQAINKVKKN